MSAARIYIRKTTEGAHTKNVLDDFGFYIKEIPFPLTTEAKDIETVSYYDEDGDEEYIPSVIRVKGYDMSVTLTSRGDRETLYGRYVALRNYLLGRDGTGAEFMLYDDWHGIGRTGIRLKKFDDDANFVDLGDEEFMLAIKLSLKVNDPLTEIAFCNGELDVYPRLLIDADRMLLITSNGFCLTGKADRKFA